MARTTSVLIIVLLFQWIDGTADVFASEVHRIRIDGIINPISAKFITIAVSRAESAKADAVLIELDTPGGLLDATRDIVQCFLAAKVPIIVYVSPDGARAGSAGTFITMAAHVAAMAPGSNIGAAHPVNFGGGGFGKNDGDSAGGSVMSDKVTNDAAALIRSIAETRGRNADWADKAVRHSESITAKDALSIGVIDFIAPSVDSLLSLIDGRTVKVNETFVTLTTKQAKIITFEMSWREELFNKLNDPNIAYIFMLIGVYGILFELYNPGAVLPGVAGGFGLLLSFFAFQTLPVNAVGALLIVFSIVLFLLEIKITSYGMLSVAGALSFFLGSLMLFESTFPAVHVSIGVIIPAVVFTLLFFLFAIGMGLKAQKGKVQTGREGLIGMHGAVLGNFTQTAASLPFSGNVLVNGEYWKAECKEELQEGVQILVKEVDGMKLIVSRILVP